MTAFDSVSPVYFGAVAAKRASLANGRPAQDFKSLLDNFPTTKDG
ncbi:hypothetical protein [Candidatus Leptofilum sp.]